MYNYTIINKRSCFILFPEVRKYVRATRDELCESMNQPRFKICRADETSVLPVSTNNLPFNSLSRMFSPAAIHPPHSKKPKPPRILRLLVLSVAHRTAAPVASSSSSSAGASRRARIVPTRWRLRGAEGARASRAMARPREETPSDRLTTRSSRGSTR